jgi:hypothetical protein
MHRAEARGNSTNKYGKIHDRPVTILRDDPPGRRIEHL